MALFDLAALDAYTRSDVDPATAAAARSMATALVVNYTGQNLEAATYRHRLPVNSAGHVRLPQRPVTAVTTVTVGGQLLAADQWQWDGMSASVWLRVTPPDRQWTAVVTYDAGYPVVPADVAAVALDIAASVVTRQPGVTSEAIDDYRVTYTDGDAALLSDTHRRLLRRYRQVCGSLAPATGWQSV